MLMKIVIISDLHGNFDALSALPESGDELWVLGDLVNYGPQPSEVVNFVRAHAAVVVRGNHDNAVGFEVEPRCNPRYHAMASATMQVSTAELDQAAKAFLRGLPKTSLWNATASGFCCATPYPPTLCTDTAPKARTSGDRKCNPLRQTTSWLATRIRRSLTGGANNGREPRQPGPAKDWKSGCLLRRVAGRTFRTETVFLRLGEDCGSYPANAGACRNPTRPHDGAAHRFGRIEANRGPEVFEQL